MRTYTESEVRSMPPAEFKIWLKTAMRKAYEAGIEDGFREALDLATMSDILSVYEEFSFDNEKMTRFLKGRNRNMMGLSTEKNGTAAAKKRLVDAGITAVEKFRLEADLGGKDE